MKIAFLTSCLEPGKDGVGDYTTMLAAECRRRGHDAVTIALNDPHAQQERPDVGVLRLSSLVPWRKRVKKAREFLSAYNPDFTSVQFVSYAFHPKGMDFRLASRLRKIIGGGRVHIMFHELWIGAEAGAPFKMRVIGGIQRALILRMIHLLNPRAVHTSNAAYVQMLWKRNILAGILPMFGAVPPHFVLPPKEDELVFGMFGAIPPEWPPEPLISLLLETGEKIVIAHIGDIGAGGKLWEKMEREHRKTVQFRRIGRASTKRIEQFLGAEIDFGIAAAPWELVGKSASTAAMLEHGLPVVVNRDDWRLPGAEPSAPISPLLIKMDRQLPQKLAAVQRGRAQSMLPAVAAQFLDDLEGGL